MGSDTSGYSIVEQGTLPAIQKGGILGLPYTDQAVLSSKYEGGTVHSPNTFLSKGIGIGIGFVTGVTGNDAQSDKIFAHVDVDLGRVHFVSHLK